MLEAIRGIGNIVFIAVLAGAIAYVGDRVGHQVGRKRLTMFGMRPKYTSTMIAVGTGMLIALAVTLIAIFASQRVETAFFRLGEINAQIADLQRKENDLEAKVTSGRLVVPVGTVMTPSYVIIRKNASSQARYQALKDLYDSAVQFVNQTYPRAYGLKKFVVPKDVDKQLRASSDEERLQLMVASSDVLVTVVADQNLFINDPIHFELDFNADTLKFSARELIAQIVIPGHRHANVSLALRQLGFQVSAFASRVNLPEYFQTVVPVASFPDQTQMQQMIDQPGTYVMTAFAAADIYTHTGDIPIVVTLQPAPK